MRKKRKASMYDGTCFRVLAPTNDSGDELAVVDVKADDVVRKHAVVKHL